MPTWLMVLLIVLAVVLVLLVVLFFVGRKMQKRVNEQQTLIDQSKMVTSILVIDKKKMKIQDSNLPKIVQEQVPFYLKFRKVPLVKAKIGPKIMTLMCDEKVYKELPVKTQVKVELAGMYIVGIKGGKKPETTTTKKKATESVDKPRSNILKGFKLKK